jgi:predicted NAD-dependent protein-ADP-ribosyltransferase YbiA (DUF1768 family)
VSATPGPSFADVKAVFQVSDAMYDLRVTQERIAMEAKSMERQLLDAFEAGWNAHIDALFDAGRDPDHLAAENARLRDALVSLRDRLRECSEDACITAWEAYDSFYQELVDEALSPAPAKKEEA